MEKFCLTKSRKQKPVKQIDGDVEVIEFELDGVVFNRVTKPREQVKEVIKAFYEVHRRRNCQAYLIKQSKMNFTPLTEQ